MSTTYTLECFPPPPLRGKRGPPPKDITGRRFGRLVAILAVGGGITGTIWELKCDCGAVVRATGRNVRCGNTKSCGCLSRDKTRERARRRPWGWSLDGKNKTTPKKCSVCGKITLGSSRHNKRVCSPACREHKLKIEKWRSRKAVTCVFCRCAFTPFLKGVSYCSDECRKRAGWSARATVRKLLAPAGVVNPLIVFARAGWRCESCRRKLSPKHRGTFRPEAPEVDHIFPLSKGGEHSYVNTRSTCRGCNIKKSATPEGQLWFGFEAHYG